MHEMSATHPPVHFDLYLIQLLQYEAVPALDQFGQVRLLSVVLPVEEEPESRRLTQRPKRPQEVAGLAAASVWLVEHLKEEAELTGETELLGAEVVPHGAAHGLHEVEHLRQGGQFVCTCTCM